MNVLIDTCVVLDFLQRRKPFDESALMLFQAAAKDEFTGCITAKSVTDIYYPTHHCTNSARESRAILEQLLDVVSVLDTAAADVFHAISSEVTDFEDAVMIATAIRSEMSCIIARNAKDYAKSSVPVYTPDEFIKILYLPKNDR